MLPLAAILWVQTGLSLHLVGVNTAFEDEGLYLWAGHLEFSHWFFGTAIPQFPTYFSGAPVIYPVIGAFVDSYAGLTGARLLSLCFMLGATTLLWATTARFYGRRAGFVAAGLWALLGPTVRLGAFATYDAMSLFSLALAAWFATAARGRRDATKLMVAAAAAMTLANVTKYATAIFDPTILGLAILAGYPVPGGKDAWRRGAMLLFCTVLAVIALLQIGRGWYTDGIDQTTLARQSAATAIPVILLSSLEWTGAVAIPAAAAVVVCLIRRTDTVTRVTIALLAASCLLVPADQARIHTFTSLSKHVDFGAWFAAIAVGYGADRAIAALRSDRLRATVTAALPALLVPVAVTGMYQATGFFSWPGVARLVPAVRGLLRPGDRLFADNTPPLEYYLSDVTVWQQWSSVYGITLPSGRKIPESTDSFAPFRKALADHDFNLIILGFTDKPPLDRAIAAYLNGAASGYRLVQNVPFSDSGGHGSFMIWEYTGSAGTGA